MSQPIQTPKKRRKVLRRILRAALILILLAALAVGGLFIYRKANPVQAVIYQPYTASRGTVSNALSFSGSLQLIDNATYTAQQDGKVTAVYAAPGDQVKEGQKLLRLSGGQSVEAEFDGQVNQLFVARDDRVAAGDQLVQVADFSRMKVSLRVDEYDISDVKVGQAVRVTVTATEQTLETVIDSINYISAATGSVAYYTATAYVDVPQGVYPGMQVTVSVPQSEALDAVVLKLDALSFDERNRAYVLMAGAEGAMEKVSVTTGVSNGNYVQIVSGLAEGDVVYKEAEAAETGGGLLGGLFQFSAQPSMGGGRGNMQRPTTDTSQRSFTRPSGGSQGGGNR